MTALRTIPGLTTTCPVCGGDGVVPRFGGNNPDGRNVRCVCDNGEVPVWCSGCRNQAVEVVSGLPWCSGCATDQKENA